MFKINSSLQSSHSVNGKIVDNRELNISSNGKQNDLSGKINGKKIKVNNIDTDPIIVAISAINVIPISSLQLQSDEVEINYLVLKYPLQN